MIKWLVRIVAGFVLVVAVGFALPQQLIIPVSGAGVKDWNHKTFWYEPWGKSGVHKGIDIFARKGTSLLSATYGIVIFVEQTPRGGNSVGVLGPKWRVHYYAHLDSVSVKAGQLVRQRQQLGTVGNTGNAKNKPSHVHYAIVSLFPYIWLEDDSTQGWKKQYYLDPGKMLLEALSKTKNFR